MPGIVGLISRMSRDRAESQLKRMIGTMCHESFYGTGSYVDERVGAYVAWTARNRTDAMPIRSPRGDVLVLSGEDYSGPHLGQRLQDDPGFLASLNGRFHGFTIDHGRRAATVFNDRYGLHRLYYHESPDAFYFAAEAKAILAVCPELRTADARSLGELVACGCVLENRTIFKGIRVLPPASAWVVKDAAVQAKSVYFQPAEWEEQDVLEPEAYYGRLRDVFSAMLPRYFQASDVVGMSLTGGLDSRMIMAWQRPSPGTMPCYSFGGMFRECRDVRVARQVAAACGQPYQVIPVGREFLSRFAQYAERTVYLSDGCVEVNHTPDLYVNERARQIAPIRMTGNYGGEVLRRVRAFKPVEPKAGLFRPEFLGHVRAASATYAGIVAGHPLSFAVFKQAPWHHYGLLALEESQLSLRSPYLDNEFVRTVFRAPSAVLTSNDLCLKLIADGNPTLRGIRTDRGLAGNQNSLAAKALRSWLEFTFKAEYASDYGMPQWAARIDHRLSALHLERLFLGKHKFYHFRVWYRDALAGYVREMLLDPRTLSRSYLDSATVETMVRGHLKGDRNYTSEIHKVLTLELIHRLFLDQPAPPSAAPGGLFERRQLTEAVTTVH